MKFPPRSLFEVLANYSMKLSWNGTLNGIFSRSRVWTPRRRRRCSNFPAANFLRTPKSAFSIEAINFVQAHVRGKQRRHIRLRRDALMWGWEQKQIHRKSELESPINPLQMLWKRPFASSDTSQIKTEVCIIYLQKKSCPGAFLPHRVLSNDKWMAFEESRINLNVLFMGFREWRARGINIKKENLTRVAINFLPSFFSPFVWYKLLLILHKLVMNRN